MRVQQSDAADSTAVDKRARGAAIRARRQALGIDSVNKFFGALRPLGVDRETITRAEQGVASSETYDKLERWLHQQEVENGLDEQPAVQAPPIRLTFHGLRSGLVSVEELIVEAPPDHPEELAEMVSRILERLNAENNGGGSGT